MLPLEGGRGTIFHLRHAFASVSLEYHTYCIGATRGRGATHTPQHTSHTVTWHAPCLCSCSARLALARGIPHALYCMPPCSDPVGMIVALILLLLVLLLAGMILAPSKPMPSVRADEDKEQTEHHKMLLRETLTDTLK